MIKNNELVEIWSIQDVKDVCKGISDEDALSVLKEVDRRFDANIGINWTVLRETADYILGACEY